MKTLQMLCLKGFLLFKIIDQKGFNVTKLITKKPSLIYLVEGFSR